MRSLLLLAVCFLIMPVLARASVLDELLQAAGISLPAPAGAFTLPGLQNALASSTATGVGAALLNTASGFSLDELLRELRLADPLAEDAAKDLLDVLSGNAVDATSIAGTTTASTTAATSTDALIASLWGQVRTLQEQLARLLEGEGGVPSAAPSEGGAAGLCSLSRALFRGVSGDDVVLLQNFLIEEKLLEPDLATGFFGALTEAAVQAWQAARDIVSSGSPEETGWGLVGPRTREALCSQ